MTSIALAACALVALPVIEVAGPYVRRVALAVVDGVLYWMGGET